MDRIRFTIRTVANLKKNPLRLYFAREYLDNFETVMFSDESEFNIFRNYARIAPKKMYSAELEVSYAILDFVLLNYDEIINAHVHALARRGFFFFTTISQIFPIAI